MGTDKFNGTSSSQQDSFGSFKAIGRAPAWLFKRIWKSILMLLIGFVIINGIATLVLGRRFHSEVAALKAKGYPVSMAAFGENPVPDARNGAVVYTKAFDLLYSKQPNTVNNALNNLLKSETGVKEPRPPMPTSVPSPPPATSVSWAEARRAAESVNGIIPLTQEALSKPECKFPVNWKDGINAKFPHLIRLRQLTRALCAQSLIDAHDGKMDEALSTMDLALRSSKAAKDEPTLIATLVTLSCTRTASDTLRAILKYDTPTASQSKKLFDLLSKTDYRTEFAYAVKSEIALGLWVFDYTLKNGVSGILETTGNASNPGEQPTTLVRMGRGISDYAWRPMLYVDGGIYLKHTITNAQAAAEPYRDAVKQIEVNQSTHLPQYAIVSRILTPIFSKGSILVDSTRAQTALTQILLASQFYKSKTGSYPESIAQLRSKITWTLPVDPYTGKDFIYKRNPNGFQAYSIGSNLKDDGGRPAKEHYNPDDGDIVLYWER